MNLFPSVDPIPLPAPVWLFKALHILTLALHFIAMETLLGGLLIATLLSLRARDPQSTAAASMARRLPIVMTYVINLGVPPLLFAQVLYGRALYTSSVLIGAHWISIIPGLMACYWLLYRFSGALEKGKSAWWLGLLAFLFAGGISRIYTSNMTLMLRPEVWSGMYARSAAGAFLPHDDPTLTPRWLFMVAGGMVMGGIWMIYLSGRRTIPETAREFLARTGGIVCVILGGLQVGAAIWAVHVQPEVVQSGLNANALYRAAGLVWLGSIAAAVLLGIAGIARSGLSRLLAWPAIAIALVSSLAMTIYRDGLRDLTLLGKGFDVWQRAVETNWSVVILFLLVFVGGLIAVGWLISVVARARKPMEGAV